MDVRQGDAVAIVLFIVVMQAMGKTLMLLWKQSQVVTPEFRFHKEAKACHDKMKGQNFNIKETTINVFISLYIGCTGSFLFELKKT